MPEATDAVLTALVEAGHFEAYRVKGLRDSADARYLGVVGVANSHPTFHVSDSFPFAGKLLPDSRFEVRYLRRVGRPTIVFVVFRQFDLSPRQKSPEEIVAGWVPEEEEEQARAWVNEMNNRIRAYPVEFEPPPGETVALWKYFAIRTRFPGTLVDVVQQVERVLACTFFPSTNRGDDGDPGFQARWDGLLISLSESPPIGELPRRIRMSGIPDRDDLPLVTSEVDVSAQMIDRLVLTSAEWYVAGEEELRTEKEAYC